MNTKQAEKQHIVEFQQEETFKLVIKMNEVISMLSKSEIYTGFVNLYKKKQSRKRAFVGHSKNLGFVQGLPFTEIF